jgi:hypothetical protein
MNFFEVQTRYTAIIYLPCIVLIVTLMTRIKVNFPELTRNEHLICVALGVALFLPRLAYLLEGALGHSVNVVTFDDALHLQEMVSIIHTPQFPPRSTFDEARFLSYYYAPWMFGAALYWVGLLSTAKQALALTVLAYVVFANYSVVYASKILFSEERLQKAFLVVCFLYGGFDFIYWLSNLSYVPSHSEWWAEDFGFEIQYSNYFTLALWVQQHLLAALIIFYALYLVLSSNTVIAAALSGLFFLSALFSSVFVVFGAAPVLAWFLFRFRLLKSAATAAAAFFTFSLPLWWIFLGRIGSRGFQVFGELAAFWQDKKRAAFLVFLLIISLELLPLIAAAFAFVRRRKDLAWLFAIAVLFVLSTFFLYFGAGGNYSTRGAIVPIFVLSYLSVPGLAEWWQNSRHRWLTVTLSLLYSLGGLLEYATFAGNSLTSFSESKSALNVALLSFNKGTGTLNAAEIKERYVDSHTTWEPWYSLERKGWQKQHDPYFDPLDNETTNADVGYRITAARVFGQAASRSSPLRSQAAVSKGNQRKH